MGFSDFPLVSSPTSKVTVVQLHWEKLRAYASTSLRGHACPIDSWQFRGLSEITAGADYENACALPGQIGIMTALSVHKLPLNLMSTCRYQKPCGGGPSTPAHTLVTRRCVDVPFCKTPPPWLLQALTLSAAKANLISGRSQCTPTALFNVSPCRS
jgi:hypothetical protein